tara:strand:- start:3633 stop:3935 length:303 start_codon:yes stop_codon:yes gene_type:complete
MSDVSKLSKDELEALGREYGIELDRRLLKSKMVSQLQKYIDSLPAEQISEPVVEVSITDDLTDIDNISIDELVSLAEGYGVDTSVIGTKGKLISSLIGKL